jgi:ABC-2 type transport system ATP-binding protein
VDPGVSVLDVQNVAKSFASVHAVNGVSFSVRRGEIFALLGPNGAGKTTLVRMLLGIFWPDSGRFEYSLCGKPQWPLPEQLGYLPEDRGLYKDIPILRTLVYFGILRGLKRRQARASAMDWLKRMNLADRAGERLEALSKGNQQKVQFISAMLHRPAFAILDEPFSGLDPLNQEYFSTLIRELRDEGMTILLSAHQMQVVEKLADRVLLMNRGREVVSGTLDEIRRKTEGITRLGLRVRGTADPAVLVGHPAVARVETNGNGRVTLHVRNGASLSDVLVRAGTSFDILEVHTERLTLHDIYVRAMSDNGFDSRDGP